MPFETTQIIQTDEYFNQKICKNNKIFAAIYLVLHVLFLFMYGFFVRYQSNTAMDTGGLNSELALVVGTAVLVLLGFGLVLTYLKKLAWSGIGFTFLITVITIQYYFLISAFWNKARIGVSDDQFTDSEEIHVWLSDRSGITEPTDGITVTYAFKCALSMVVAFSAILGRAGPLEALIMIIIGVPLYEMNRQVVSRVALDIGGSMTIFCFGGFYGGFVGLLLGLKQKEALEEHDDYTSTKQSATFACFGAALCFVFYPVLVVDVQVNQFIGFLGGVSMYYGIAVCLLTTVALSSILYSRVRVKDFIYGIVGGGVILATSSSFMYNPLAAMLLGFLGGILTVVFNNIEEKMAKKPYFVTNCLFMFGILGLLGGIFSAPIRAVSAGTIGTFNFNEITFPYNFRKSPEQLAGAFIAAGFGIVSGLIAGIFVRLANKEEREDMFNDRTYWISQYDGISFEGTTGGNVFEGAELKGKHAYM